MTYQTLLNLTTGYLTGDNVLPKDDDVKLALLESAFSEIADKADSLHLMTLSATTDVLRLGEGAYLIRMPLLPSALSDVLDIDHELCFPLARILASYLSKDKGGIHVNAANRRILDYNAKVLDIKESLKAESTCDIV